MANWPLDPVWFGERFKNINYIFCPGQTQKQKGQRGLLQQENIFNTEEELNRSLHCFLGFFFNDSDTEWNWYFPLWFIAVLTSLASVAFSHSKLLFFKPPENSRQKTFVFVFFQLTTGSSEDCFLQISQKRFTYLSKNLLTLSVPVG